MRQTITLNRPLPNDTMPHKRYFIGENQLTTELMLKLLKEKGIVVTEKNMPTNCPCKIYKGIEVGSTFYGVIVWARKSEEQIKLKKLMMDDGYYVGVCQLPVEIRRDK